MNGTIVKRGDLYSIVLDLGRDPSTGKRVRKWHSGYKTKKLAESARVDLLHALEHGTYAQPSKTTTGEFLLRWLDTYARPNVAPLTFQRYTQIVKGRLLRDLGAIPLRKLRPEHILSARAKWAAETKANGQPISARSVLHHHRVLREALGHAVKWQVLAVNPALAVDPPRVERAQIATLDVAQAQAVLTTAQAEEGPYGAAVALALLTGLRLGEVLGLAWPSVDLPKRQARVRQSVQQIRGRGLILREPKTAKSVRNISLPAQAVALLSRVEHEQKLLRMQMGSGFQDRRLVFTTPTGAPLNPQNVRRHYHLLLAAARVPRVRFHDLRHTHATLMLSEGVHPKIVSERLGHANIGITLDTYSHVLPNLQEEAARKLDALLSGPTPTAAGGL